MNTLAKDAVTHLQPGQRWPTQATTFVLCAQHTRGRQFSVWADGKCVEKVLNQPDRAFQVYRERLKTSR